jgi:hypothetical protein
MVSVAARALPTLDRAREQPKVHPPSTATSPAKVSTKVTAKARPGGATADVDRTRGHRATHPDHAGRHQVREARLVHRFVQAWLRHFATAHGRGHGWGR